MKEVIQVSRIKAVEFPQHHKCFGREIYGPNSGCNTCSVVHNYMFADGGAEMHVHEKCEHIFYVIRGALKFNNGKDDPVIVRAGEAVVAHPGEPHEVTGTGGEDVEYIVCSAPPAWTLPKEGEKDKIGCTE